jgi:hypothetical protein
LILSLQPDLLVAGMARLDHERPILKLIDAARRAAAEERSQAAPCARPRAPGVDPNWQAIQSALFRIALDLRRYGDWRTAALRLSRLPDRHKGCVTLDDLAPWARRHLALELDPDTGCFVRVKGTRHVDLRPKQAREAAWWNEAGVPRPSPAEKARRTRARKEAIRSTLVEAAGAWARCGDWRALARRIEALERNNPDLLHQGSAFDAWLKRHLGFLREPDGRGFRRGALRHHDVDLAKLADVPWWKGAAG